MAKNTVKCLICGYENEILVNHIERDHELSVEEYTERFPDAPLFHEGADRKAKKAKKQPAGDALFGLEKEKDQGDQSFKDLIPVEEEYFFPEEITTFVANGVKANQRVLLTGDCGGGKSSLIEQLAARAKHPMMRVNLNGQTTPEDLIGRWGVRDGKTYWIDGLLTLAMKHGFWFLLDEVDFGEAAVLSLLHPVLEPNGKLVLKEKDGEIVKAHPKFRLFATGNTLGIMGDKRALYQGANVMNEAFMDRWLVVHVPYPSKEVEAKIIKSKAKTSDTVTEVVLRVAEDIRRMHNQQEISCTFSTRRCIQWAQLIETYRKPILAAKLAILNKLSPVEAQTVQGVIQRIAGNDEE